MTNSCPGRPSSATPGAPELLLPAGPCLGRTAGSGSLLPLPPKMAIFPPPQPSSPLPHRRGDPASPEGSAVGLGTSRGTHPGAPSRSVG